MDCLNVLSEIANKSLHHAPRIILNCRLDIRPEKGGERISKKWEKIKQYQHNEGDIT